MIDHDRFIKSLGKCYQLHIEALGMSPEGLHRRYLDTFYKAMRLRSIRRVRPTYLRLVNIEDHTHLLDRTGPVGSVDIDAPRLNTYQVIRCFDWPIKVDSVDHVTQRIITRMHPLVVITKLLAAHPKQIISFRFGLSHTLYLTPLIDEDDYFTNDPMPFRYKRMTRYLPITFNHKDL